MTFNSFREYDPALKDFTDAEIAEVARKTDPGLSDMNDAEISYIANQVGVEGILGKKQDHNNDGINNPGELGSLGNIAYGNLVSATGAATKYISSIIKDSGKGFGIDADVARLTGKQAPKEDNIYNNSFADPIIDYGNNVRNNVSPEYKAAMQKNFFAKDNSLESDNSAWTDPRAIVGTVASGVAQFVPSAIATLVTKNPAAGAAIAASMEAGGAKQQVYDTVTGLDEKTISTSPLYKDLVSKGMPKAEAQNKVAYDLAKAAASETAIVSGALEYIGGKYLLDGVLGNITGSVAKKLGVQTIAQGGTEGFQGLTQQGIQNLNVKQADNSVNVTDNLANSAAQESLGGIGVAGVIGGYDAYKNRNKSTNIENPNSNIDDLLKEQGQADLMAENGSDTSSTVDMPRKPEGANLDDALIQVPKRTKRQGGLVDVLNAQNKANQIDQGLNQGRSLAEHEQAIKTGQEADSAYDLLNTQHANQLQNSLNTEDLNTQIDISNVNDENSMPKNVFAGLNKQIESQQYTPNETDLQIADLLAKPLPSEQLQEQSTPIQEQPNVLPGKPGVITSEKAGDIGYQYELVEAKDLQPQTETASNQARDRNRADTQEQVINIANNIKPSLLLDSPTMRDGAPVVSPSGQIIAGNGRTMAIQQAYNSGKADRYKQEIASKASKFGFNKSQVEAMQNPVIVRRLNQEDTTGELAILSNEEGSASMSPLEQAAVDAKRIGSVSDLEVNADGEISNDSFTKAAKNLVKLTGMSKRGDLMTADGRLSESGKNRVRNAVLYKAYGNSPILSQAIESQDDGFRNITKALVSQAPQVASIKDGIEQNQYFDASIDGLIVDVINLYSDAKAKGLNVEEYIAQDDMFGTMTNEEKTLLNIVSQNIMKPKAIAEFISKYNNALMARGAPNQNDMFGSNEPTVQELLDYAEQQIKNNRPGKQRDARQGKRDNSQSEVNATREAKNATGNTDKSEPGEQDQLLTQYTPEDLKQRDDAQNKAKQQEVDAIERDKQQATADSFNLTGSDTNLDQAAAQGQTDMLGELDNSTVQNKDNSNKNEQVNEVQDATQKSATKATQEAEVKKEESKDSVRQQIDNVRNAVSGPKIKQSNSPMAKQVREVAGNIWNGTYSDVNYQDKLTEQDFFNQIRKSGQKDDLGTELYLDKFNEVNGTNYDYDTIVNVQESVKPVQKNVQENADVKLSASGKPFKSEKTARMSKTFKSLDNGEVVPVDGGFGVRESKPSQEILSEPKAAETTVNNDIEQGISADNSDSAKKANFNFDENQENDTPMFSRTNGKLDGSPDVKGGGQIPAIVKIAKDYAKENGINLQEQSRYVDVDEGLANRLSDAYESMKNEPENPVVKEAYENLAKQTMKQYKALEDAGYKFYFYDSSNDPYNGNPWEAIRDLRNNKRMGVYMTEDGFGSDSSFDSSSNPLLSDTGITWPYGGMDGKQKRVLVNDLFRAVHDAFGHGMEGSGFRAQGEENAWQAHNRMFTGSALGALTSETRGQNSWLNYGKYGDKNRNAKVEDTVFADQKIGLMPEWASVEGNLSHIDNNEFSTIAVEALPSTGLLDGRIIKRMSLEKQSEYHQQVMKMMNLDDGTNVALSLAGLSKIESSTSPSVYQGHVGESEQIKVKVDTYVNADGFEVPTKDAVEKLELAAAIQGYILEQDAVVNRFLVPLDDSKADKADTVSLDYGRVLTHEEVREMVDAVEKLSQELGFDSSQIAFPTTSYGVDIINVSFGDIDTKLFDTIINKAVEHIPDNYDATYSNNALMENGYIGGFNGYRTGIRAYKEIRKKWQVQSQSQSNTRGSETSKFGRWNDDIIEQKKREIKQFTKRFVEENRYKGATNRSIAENNDEAARKSRSRIIVDNYTPSKKDTKAQRKLDRATNALADKLATEAEEILKGGDKDARGWYTSKYQEAIDLLADIHPEFKSSKQDRNLFTAIVALTSDGTAVVDNLKNALKIYENYKQKGKLDSLGLGAERASSYKQNIRRLSGIINKYGVEGMVNYMTETMPSNVLQEEVRSMDGFSKNWTTGYIAETEVPRAMVFGAKLGAFFSNLMGHPNYLTMDRWWTRTVNRLRGQLASDPATDKSIEEFKQIIGKPNARRSTVIKIAKQMQKAYADSDYKDKRPEYVKANTIIKNETGTRDAPTGGGERKFMIDATAQALGKLLPKYPELNMADLQAVLWFGEKRKFKELGGNSAKAAAEVDYLDAAREVLGYDNPKFSRNDEIVKSEASEQSNESADIKTLRESIEKHIGGRNHSYKESDLGLPDNTRRALESLFGRRIVGFETERGYDFNGVVIPTNEKVIYVNTKSDKPIMNVIGHEFLHGLRRDNTKLYNQALNAFSNVMHQKDFDQFIKDFNAKTDANGEARQSEQVIAEELMADVLGDNFTEQAFWAKVSQHLDNEQPGTFNKLIKAVKAFLSKVANKLSPLGSSKYLDDVEAAQDVVAEMAALHMKSQMGNKKAKEKVDNLADNYLDIKLSRQINQDNGKGSPAWESAKAKGLDMSHEARMKRARDMGFDTDTVYYHGSFNDIESFNISGENNILGRGVYLTSSKDDASAYASKEPSVNLDIVGKAEQLSKELGVSYKEAKDIVTDGNESVYPVFVKKSKRLDITNNGLEFNGYPIDTSKERIRNNLLNSLKMSGVTDAEQTLLSYERLVIDPVQFYEKGDITSAKIATSKQAKGDIAKQVVEVLGQGIRDIAVTYNAKAILMKDGSAPMPGRSNKNAEHLVLLDNKYVRSINAAFDPDMADSPNLMFSRKDSKPTQDDGTLESFRSKFGREDTKTTVKKWAKEFFNNLQLRLAQGIFDKYRPLLAMDKSLYGDDVIKNNTTHSSWVLAKMSEAGQSALSVMMQYGRIKYDSKQKVLQPTEDSKNKGFLIDMAEILGSSEEIDRFFRWVAANRSSELMKQDKEHLFTDKEIEFGLRENEGKLESGKSRKEAYLKAHQKFKMYHNDVLDIATQAGIVSKESRADWENQFYVPFYRVMDDDTVQNPGVSGGSLKPKEAYKKLKGGTQNVNDLLENTLMNWNHLLTNSMRNMASQQAIANAEEAGIATKMKYNDKSKRKTHVFVDGKKVEYDISDQLVFDALTMITHSGIKGTSMDLARGFKRVFTNFTTASPQFIVANLIRDSLQAVAVTDGSSYNVAKNIGKGSKQFGTGLGKRMTKERAQIMAAGGSFSFGYVYGRNTDDVKYSIDKQMGKIIHTPSDAKSVFTALGRVTKTGWDKWQSINDMTENVNRMSIYDTINTNSDNKLYAALQARDLMDFSAHGSYQAIRFLTDVVPFLNARLQGLDKIYRSGAKPSANALRAMFGGKDASATDKQLAMRFAAVTGALTLATLALRANNEDDEDYRKLEDWHKDTYWSFKIDGDWYHIPKPFEVGAIATLAERLQEQVISDNPEVDAKLFRKRVYEMAMGTFSFDPTPQIVKPALELWANTDSFTDRPIESTSMQRLSPERRYRSSTSELAKGLSNAGTFLGDANISPVQYDHLIKGYLGWLGATASGYISTIVNTVEGKESPAKAWYEYQPARRFYTNLDKPTYTKYSTMFYEYLRESNRIYSDINAMRKEGIEFDEYRKENMNKLRYRKLLNKIQRTISKINARMNIIKGSNKPADVKRQELDVLQTRKNLLQERAVKKYLGG